MLLNPLIAGIPGLVVALAGGPGGSTLLVQYGSRFIDPNAPKVQFYAPPPDAPVAPVIMPPGAQPPPAAPPAAPPPPSPAPRPPPVRPAAPPHAANAPYFVPGQRGEPAAPASEPSTTVENFYRTYLEIRTPGLPNAAQRARLRPFLSPALEAALATAEQGDKSYVARKQGNVPPLVGDDAFASYGDGADSYHLRECAERTGGMQCIVQLSRTDPATKQKIEWRDTFLLVRLAAGWRIDDVVYGGKFGLGNMGQLSELLRIVIKESKE